MTKANSILQLNKLDTIPQIFYQVAMSQPQSHLFEVTLTIKNWQLSTLNLKMPVWTPGSYLVREYARHLQEFMAEKTTSQENLVSKKVSKNHWQIQADNCSDITVKYKIFAYDLSVRTNHLDETHGYFNGAALFLYIPNLENQPITVKIIPPQSDWQVTTALPKVAGKINTFLAADFDTLVDNPFEIGTHQLYEFEVLNKPHQLAIWGEGNYHAPKILEDIQKIIEAEANLFGGLPYEKYVFLLHLSPNKYGGLEHKNSCTLDYSSVGFQATDKYHNFIQLVAHEFFHLWNVKRIRPKPLEIFDYDQENYTTSLWFSEGTTSYYDLLFPLWAGIYNRQTFLENLGKEITRFYHTPGRKIQALSESSFDAWIKLYRRDSNSDNSQMSYYLKGELVSLLLDLLIRSQSQNKRSLNDVIVKMWVKFGQPEIGFTPEELKQTIESVANQDLTEFFNLYIDGKEELPIPEYLALFGLDIKPIFDGKLPYLGIKLNKETITFVEVNSPAYLAGLNPGDELLAIDNIKVTGEKLNERLKDYQSGDKIKITVFHYDELKTVTVELVDPQPIRYDVVLIEPASLEQQQNLSGWLIEQ